MTEYVYPYRIDLKFKDFSFTEGEMRQSPQLTFVATVLCFPTCQVTEPDMAYTKMFYVTVSRSSTRFHAIEHDGTIPKMSMNIRNAIEKMVFAFYQGFIFGQTLSPTHGELYMWVGITKSNIPNLSIVEGDVGI